MTISSKFWLIGYIHIGLSYLREKIATSGHLLHFHRNITTHCGQGMAKAFYQSNLALSTHVEKFPKRSNMKLTFCQSHLEDYSWENKIGGRRHWYNWAIKTYLLQWGSHWFSWECQHTQTFAISDGFCIFQT